MLFVFSKILHLILFPKKLYHRFNSEQKYAFSFVISEQFRGVHLFQTLSMVKLQKFIYDFYLSGDILAQNLYNQGTE